MNMHRAQRSLYLAERKTHAQHEKTDGQLPGGQHVKNWRPQILAFVDAFMDNGEWSVSQDSLLDVLSELRKGGGLTMVVSIMIGDVHQATHAKSDMLERIKDALHNACIARKLEVYIHVPFF